MDFTPESIHDASFALTPSGCNPARVEETLATIAEHLTNGEPISADLLQADFDTVAAGFSPQEVAAFFAALRQRLLEPSRTTPPASTDAPQADLSPALPEDDVHPSVDNVPESDDASPAQTRGAGPAGSPAGLIATASIQRNTSTARGSLPSAIERTKLAVSELETFVVHQMEEAKAGLRLYIDQTQTDCQNTLDTARTVSDQALDTARQRAEVLLDIATRTTKQLRDRFDSELASMQAAFEEELGRRHAAIQADVEALVTEAHTLTEEAHAQLAEVHDDTRASLDDARSVLMGRRLAA
jgi:hypothetical protein